MNVDSADDVIVDSADDVLVTVHARTRTVIVSHVPNTSSRPPEHRTLVAMHEPKSVVAETIVVGASVVAGVSGSAVLKVGMGVLGVGVLGSDETGGPRGPSGPKVGRGGWLVEDGVDVTKGPRGPSGPNVARGAWVVADGVGVMV